MVDKQYKTSLKNLENKIGDKDVTPKCFTSVGSAEKSAYESQVRKCQGNHFNRQDGQKCDFSQ